MSPGVGPNTHGESLYYIKGNITHGYATEKGIEDNSLHVVVSTAESIKGVAMDENGRPAPENTLVGEHITRA